MKKFFALMLCFLWVFTFVFYSSASDETNNNYNLLRNKGFDEEYLDELSENTMQKMIGMIGDGKVSNVEIKETTFSCNNSLMRGNINPDNLTLEMATGIISSDDSNEITSIIVRVSWEWGRWAPLYRGKDAVAVNWDEDLFAYVEDSFYAEDYYKFFASDEWNVLNSYDVLSASNQGGIGHWTDLEEWQTYVAGCMVFLLEPTERMLKGDTYTTTVNVEYVHEKSALTGLSLNIGDYGVGISWNSSCDTMADTSTLKFSR